ncbi:olfactory receptor 5V1-like [Rhinophrynus dorsalis]
MDENLKNSTLLMEFYLLAFPSFAEVKLALFIVILLIYLLALLGNVIITALVCLVSHLQIPMYFFLCNLAIQDIIYVSTIQPKLLAITITDQHGISFAGCITQIFLFVLCLQADYLILTAMAYDRYVAICIPLRYWLIMNKRVCIVLATAAWLIACFNGLLHSLLMSDLIFCKSHNINHFFCEMKTMFALSCSDTSRNKYIIYFEICFIGFFPFALIITSYVFIISAILKISTSIGRAKAFSSCSSHLTVVILFYVTSLSFYMKPESEHSQEEDKLLSILYVALVPMLNPLVYSLRNKEVLKAMKTVIKVKPHVRRS